MLQLCRFVEELVRRALFTLCIRLSTRADDVGPDALLGRPLRVLFIMEDALGDTIVTLPAIRAIAEAFPGNVVDVATWDAPGELMAHSSYIHRVIRFPRHDRRRWNAWRVIARHGPYDAIVDGMVLRGHVRSRSFAMMLGSGARYWVGEHGRGSDYLLNVAVARPKPGATQLERMLGLAKPFLTRPPVLRPLLCLTEDEIDAAEEIWGRWTGGRRILINVSTNGPERRWPAARFAAVARHVRRHEPNARLVVVGLDRDRDTAELIAAAGRGQVYVPSVRELVALVASTDLVISPDTAVSHIASAFARTLVSIHNHGKEMWHPFETPGYRVVGPSEKTIEDVPELQVLRAVRAALDDLAAVSTSPATTEAAAIRIR
jgi:heptosyltransferase-2